MITEIFWNFSQKWKTTIGNACSHLLNYLLWKFILILDTISSCQDHLKWNFNLFKFVFGFSLRSTILQQDQKIHLRTCWFKESFMSFFPDLCTKISRLCINLHYSVTNSWMFYTVKLQSMLPLGLKSAHAVCLPGDFQYKLKNSIASNNTCTNLRIEAQKTHSYHHPQYSNVNCL